MITDLELIAQSLEGLGERLIINNHEIARYIEVFCAFVPPARGLTEEAVLLLNEQTYENCEILQSTANLIVIDTVEPSVSSHVGPDANAIILPAEVSVEEVIRRTQETLEGLRIFHRHSQRLLDMAVSGAELDDVMDVAARMLGNPVCLLVMDGSAIASSSQVETDDDLWDRLVYQKVRTTEDEDLAQVLDYAQSLFYANITRPSFFDVSPWKRRLMAGIWVGNTCNHLFVVLENDKTIGRADIIVTARLCEVISHLLEHDTVETESMAAIFESLLRGEQIASQRAYDAAVSAGLNTTVPQRMVVLRNTDQPDSYLSAMRLLDRVKHFMRDANVLVHDSHVVACLPSPSPNDTARTEDLLSQLDRMGLVASMSLELSSFEEVPRAWRQCEAAMRLGQGRVRRYEDVMPADVLNHLSADLSIADFCPQMAYEILAYDRANDTEYAWTIVRHLAHFKDRRATADELHIHQNTVRYRFERMRELFKLNPEDDALLECLRVSYLLMQAAGTKLPRG